MTAQSQYNIIKQEANNSNKQTNKMTAQSQNNSNKQTNKMTAQSQNNSNKQTNKMTAQSQYNIIKQEANNSSKYTKWPPRANTIYQTTMKN
jgi:hypothetical protein